MILHNWEALSLGDNVLKCLLHGERSSGQFASVWVQEGELQTAQCGQANLILDANYFHQLLLLNTKTKLRTYENKYQLFLILIS